MAAFDFSKRNKLVNLLNRREFFSRLGMGAGAMALASLMCERAQADAIAARQPYTLVPKAPHKPARAKRVIYLFQNGGPSQVDLFDPKPELNKRAGKKPGTGFVNDVDAKKNGAWLGSPFKFNKHGSSGLALTALMPE